MERELTPEEKADVVALESRVRWGMSAERAPPQGDPKIEEIEGGVLLYSWPSRTASVGVEKWFHANGFQPLDTQGMEELQAHGFPRKLDEVLVGLTGGHRIPALFHDDKKDNEIVIAQVEKTSGSTDDLPYDGWDWIPGTIFAVKKK